MRRRSATGSRGSLTRPSLSAPAGGGALPGAVAVAVTVGGAPRQQTGEREVDAPRVGRGGPPAGVERVGPPLAPSEHVLEGEEQGVDVGARAPDAQAHA